MGNGATVVIEGDGSTDLDLYVYDEDQRLVVRPDPPFDPKGRVRGSTGLVSTAMFGTIVPLTAARRPSASKWNRSSPAKTFTP